MLGRVVTAQHRVAVRAVRSRFLSTGPPGAKEIKPSSPAAPSAPASGSTGGSGGGGAAVIVPLVLLGGGYGAYRYYTSQQQQQQQQQQQRTDTSRGDPFAAMGGGSGSSSGGAASDSGGGDGGNASPAAAATPPAADATAPTKGSEPTADDGAARAAAEKEAAVLAGAAKAGEALLRVEQQAALRAAAAAAGAKRRAAAGRRSVSDRAADVDVKAAASNTETASQAKAIADSAIVSASSSRPERVDVGKPSPEEPSARLDKMARAAAVRAKEVAQATTADEMAELLRQDLDKSFGSDPSSMTPDQLRQRVHQLTAELRDRGKWEALRLNEFLKQSEELWKAKFVEFAEFQHQALKEEVADMVKAVEAKADAENSRWRQKQLQVLHAQLQSSAQEQLDKFMADLKQKEAATTKTRLKALGSLRGRVEAVMSYIDSHLQYEDAAQRVHRMSLAALAFLEAVQSGREATDVVAALKVAADGDDLIKSAVEALPPSVFRAGPITRRQLQDRFPTVMAEGRTAALVPAKGGVVGQALGTLSSVLFVRGAEADVSDDNPIMAINAVFDKAESAMAAGRLEEAVSQLSRLRGTPAASVADWLKSARELLTIEQSARVVRCQMGLLTESMY